MNGMRIRLWFRLIRCLNLARILNFVKIQTSYWLTKWSGNYFHWGFPWTLSIEVSGICNLHCPECPAGTRSLSRQKGLLHLQDYTHWLNESSPELFYLILYFQGEPLLNEDFVSMLKMAHQKRIYTITSTNAHFLTSELSENIVMAGLDEIVVSLDGTDALTYQKYRKGGNFNIAIEGIQQLVNARHRLGRNNPYIRLQFIVMKHNQHQLKEIRHLAKRLGVDALELKSAQIYSSTDENDFLPDIPKYARYIKGEDGLLRLKRKKAKACRRMWQGGVITWDGRLVPCCYDKDADYSYGLLNTSHHFKTLWKSPEADKFRQNVMKSRDVYEICRNCGE